MQTAITAILERELHWSHSMIIAVPVWQGRVSPVFDVAGQLLVVEADGSTEVARRSETLPEEPPERRAQRLRELGVDALICGAISGPLEAFLAAGGVDVVARVCGDVDEVLRAFYARRLRGDRYAMPGCCQRRQRRRGGRCGRGGNTW